MTLTVERPVDLYRRASRGHISKSFLAQADQCGQKAWFGLHAPRDLILNERIEFGRVLDAGVEQLMIAARAGLPTTVAKPMEAAALSMQRDDFPVDLEAIQFAVDAFERDVLPKFDLSFCLTQHHIRVEIEGIGAVDGHPDLILSDNSVFDIKSGKVSKPTDAAAVSYTELGLYALMREVETGQTVPRVGYITFVRSKKPYWQIVEAPVTDSMRRIAHARAASYIRALEADAVLNDGAATPVNGSFPSGPKWNSMCNDCPYNPALGGPCLMAGEGASDAAA